MGSLGCHYQSVEVEIDLDDAIADLSDKELLEAGLMRTSPKIEHMIADGYGSAKCAHGGIDKTTEQQWLAVREYLRRGNINDMLDQLNVMAWNQSNVMLPITAKLEAVS